MMRFFRRKKTIAKNDAIKVKLSTNICEKPVLSASIATREDFVYILTTDKLKVCDLDTKKTVHSLSISECDGVRIVCQNNLYVFMLCRNGNVIVFDRFRLTILKTYVGICAEGDELKYCSGKLFVISREYLSVFTFDNSMNIQRISYITASLLNIPYFDSNTLVLRGSNIVYFDESLDMLYIIDTLHGSVLSQIPILFDDDRVSISNYGDYDYIGYMQKIRCVDDDTIYKNDFDINKFFVSRNIILCIDKYDDMMCIFEKSNPSNKISFLNMDRTQMHNIEVNERNTILMLNCMGELYIYKAILI